MDAGLIIYNDASTVQIDQNYRNFGFKQMIPVFFDITLPAVTPYRTYTLVVPGEKAMVAVKASTFRVVMVNSWFDGTYYTYNYYLMPPTTSGYVSETVEFYVFDVIQSGAFSNVGMEVYNAASQVVFHSDMRPMKIAGFQYVSSTAHVFTGTPGRTYVPLINTNPLFVAAGRVNAWALRVVDHQIIPFEQITPKSSPYGWSNNGSFTAIDVTGLA